MASRRRDILLASIALGLAVGTNPAAAEKKYDPGATDTEIKIGNIMPYKRSVVGLRGDRSDGGSVFQT